MYLCLIKHQRSYILCCGVTTLFVKKQLALFAMACVRLIKQSRHVEEDKDNDVNYCNFVTSFHWNLLSKTFRTLWQWPLWKLWYDYHMLIIIFSGMIHVLGGRAVGHTLVSACISELFWNIFSHYLWFISYLNPGTNLWWYKWAVGTRGGHGCGPVRKVQNHVLSLNWPAFLCACNAFSDHILTHSIYASECK